MESTFKIKTVSPNGTISEGTITAASKEEAVSIIKAKNQIPIEVNETSKGIGLDLSFNIKKKVKVTDLAIFCKQLSAMLTAGMPINRALDVQEKQTENLTLRDALKEISSSIKRGEGLSKSMKAFPEIFPKILLSMIESGETTGNIDEVLERLSIHYTKENSIGNKVKGALMYPIILCVVMVVVMLIMMIKVVPTFAAMYGEGSEMPALTSFVLSVSESLQSFWFIYLGVIVGAVVFIRNYIKTEKGRYDFDALKLKFPLIAKPMQQIITARFTRTLSTLLESGISIINALGIAAETTNNVVVEDAINVAADGIKKGMSLTGEIRKTGLFPLMMTSMVGIGEETGAIETLLSKTADYYDEELDAAMSRMLSLLEPIMIVIMGLVIGVLVIAMMLPIFDMSTGAGL